MDTSYNRFFRKCSSWINGSRIQPNHACTHWVEPTHFHVIKEFTKCSKSAVQTILDWEKIGDSILSGPSSAAISERWLFTLHNQLDADASNLYDKEPVQLWHYGDPKEIDIEKAKRKEQLEGATISRFRDVFSASIQFIDQLLAELGDSRGGLKDANSDEMVLRRFVDLELKGKQQSLMRLVIDAKGSLPLKELSSHRKIGWDHPYDDAWNSIRQTLNKKLKQSGIPYKLHREKNKAVLKKLGQK